jgi:hypothetical protein
MLLKFSFFSLFLFIFYFIFYPSSFDNNDNKLTYDIAYESALSEKNLNTKILLLEALTEKNHVNSIYDLATIYLNAFPLGSNKRLEGFKLLQKSAALGHSSSQYDLALLYLDKNGFSFNPDIAKKLLFQSSLKYNSQAQFKLASILSDSLFIDEIKQSIAFLEKLNTINYPGSKTLLIQTKEKLSLKLKNMDKRELLKKGFNTLSQFDK